MYFIIVLFIGIWLGYKLKTLVEFLNLLKLKNYVEYYVNKMENSNFQVINLKKKVNKIVEVEEE